MILNLNLSSFICQEWQRKPVFWVELCTFISPCLWLFSLHSIIQFCLCIFCPGVFLWRLSFCTRDRGNPLAEGGWKEVMEEALLPSQGLRNLLCPQRQRQGKWADRTKCRCRMRFEPSKNWIYTDYLWYFLFEHITQNTCFYLTRDLSHVCALF